MPRLNAEEKEEMSKVVGEVLTLLDELHGFSEENGPKGLTRKFERAIILMEGAQESLENVISTRGYRKKR